MRNEPVVSDATPLSWRELAAAAALISLAVLAMYWYLWVEPFAMRWMATWDSLLDAIPTRFYYDHCVHQGTLPWWNPLILCGEPFGANPARGIGYPPNVVRSLLTFSPTPMKTALGLVFMAFSHMVLGGVSMYAYGREKGLSRAGGAVSALVFIFNAQYISHYMVGHWSWISMFAWLPLIVLVASRCINAERPASKFYLAALAGFLFGLVVLAGVPQVFYTMAFVIGVYAVIQRLVRPDLRRDGKTVRWHVAVFTDVLALAVLFGIGSLMAAGLVLPAMQYAALSMRGGGEALQAFVREEGMAFLDAAQLFVYPGIKDGLRFAGAGAWILAAGAFAHTKRRGVWLHAAMLLVTLDCCMGVPFPFSTLLAGFAPFEMPFPPRTLVFACFFLAMLAGYGTDAYTRAALTPRLRVSLRMTAGALGAAALMTVALYLMTDTAPERPPFATVVLPAAMVLWVFVVVRARRRVVWYRAAAVALLFGEIFAWNLAYIPSFYRTAYLGEPPGDWDYFSRERSFWADNSRGTSHLPNCNLYDLAPAIDGYSPLCLERVYKALCAPGEESEYERMISNTETTRENRRGLLLLKRQFWLARQYVPGPMPDKTTLWPPTTTVFLTNPPPDLDVPRVTMAEIPALPHSGHTAKLVVRNADGSAFSRELELGREPLGQVVMPPVNLPERHSVLYAGIDVHRGPARIDLVLEDAATKEREVSWLHTVSRDDAVTTLLFALPGYATVRPAFRCVFDRTQARFAVKEAYVVEDLEDEDSRIEVAGRGPNTVEVHLRDLPGPRILFNADADYPGWRATLDGKRVPILRANDVFKAVAVPAGSHTVRFEFTLPRARLGWTVSIVSGLATALILIGGAFSAPRRLEPGRDDTSH